MKIEKGIFYTIKNPFNTLPFMQWLQKALRDKKDVSFVEPFAGAGNIVDMVLPMLDYIPKWYCYDINPNNVDNTSGYRIIPRDTISNYPFELGQDVVCITNPPFLAKNSATRKGLGFPEGFMGFDDIYKGCLSLMLNAHDYVASILPASFVISSFDKRRLWLVDIIHGTMFNDTDEPVCVAMFVPEECDSYFISFNGIVKLSSEDINRHTKSLSKISLIPMKFNDPSGIIGIKCIDDIHKESIQFMHGEDIFASISGTSRTYTRVSIEDKLLAGKDIDCIINKANKILHNIRRNSFDMLLTPFKGLRKDKTGYRMRLSFKLARLILSKAVIEC